MPSNVVNASSIYLGRAEVFVDLFSSGTAKTGERFLGNVSAFELSTEDDVLDFYSSAEETSPLVKSVNRRRTPSISFTMNEFDEYNFALAMMGERGFATQSAATVTDEAVATASTKKGHWVQLGGATPTRTIDDSPAPVVRSAAGGGGTLYVEGTDYIVDYVRGRLFIVTAGAIPDAGPIFVTYGTLAIVAPALPIVKGGTKSFLEAFMRVIGRPATGPVWEIEFWKVSFAPDGPIALIGEDWGEVQMTAKVLADTAGHPTEPFYRAYRIS